MTLLWISTFSRAKALERQDRGGDRTQIKTQHAWQYQQNMKEATVNTERKNLWHISTTDVGYSLTFENLWMYSTSA